MGGTDDPAPENTRRHLTQLVFERKQKEAPRSDASRGEGPRTETPLAYSQRVEDEPESERDQAVINEESVEGEEGREDEERGSADGSGGGGIYFEETEHDFDDTELQGLSIPIFRNALKKGLKLASRLTTQTEKYLRNFLPDKALRSRVLEVAFSENGHRTLLLDRGEIVQYQHSRGRLERVRVSPDLEAERAVKYAMAGFIAAGESIDPKDVKFGRTPEFEARMRPVWTREWDRIQQERNELRIEGPRNDVSFLNSIDPNAAKPIWMREMAGVRKMPKGRPRIDLPRASASRLRDPEL
jgi:hypothetical protein